jgi:hypothetical protein
LWPHLSDLYRNSPYSGFTLFQPFLELPILWVPHPFAAHRFSLELTTPWVPHLPRPITNQDLSAPFLKAAPVTQALSCRVPHQRVGAPSFRGFAKGWDSIPFTEQNLIFAFQLRPLNGCFFRTVAMDHRPVLRSGRRWPCKDRSFDLADVSSLSNRSRFVTPSFRLVSNSA